MEFLNLKKQYKEIKKEIDSAVLKVLEKGTFIGGEEVEKFEEEMARFCKRSHAVALNSGTDALFLSLKAFGISKGDEVITSPFTFVATAEAISNLGAKPVFADIDPGDFNIAVSKIEEKITKRTKAVIPVHLFGQMADMEKIRKIAKKHGLKIIEDAAQAVGSEYKGKGIGTFGDCACLSFFPAKNLGAYGDGGMAVTDNKNLAEKIKMLRNHGSSKKEKYLNLELGTNSRLDAIQAAVLRVKLKHLKVWNKKRLENALYYNKSFKNVEDIKIPSIKAGFLHSFHQYTIRTASRDGLREYLKKNGIPSMIYYPLPLSLQPAFKYLECKKGEFPEAEKAGREVLSLPVGPDLSRKDQETVIKKIRDFFSK
jgi:dTDP-4-amino-4,6-dideoxygalactose transaminase